MPTAPRRQARGERRITEILTAAAGVFAEKGYEQATTNAIAAAAGISPGSLYQYFDSKDAVVGELAGRYAADLAAVQAEAFEGLDGPLESVVDRVLDPIVRFNHDHRAFKSLFARTDMPAALAAAAAPLHRALQARIVDLLENRLPDTSPVERQRIAAVAIQVVRAFMPLVTEAEPAEARWLRTELHALLVDLLRRHQHPADQGADVVSGSPGATSAP